MRNLNTPVFTMNLQDYTTAVISLKKLNAKKNGRGYAISFISIDVDGLKVINDVFGHSIGDLLLKTVANVLRTSI